MKKIKFIDCWQFTKHVVDDLSADKFDRQFSRVVKKWYFWALNRHIVGDSSKGKRKIDDVMMEEEEEEGGRKFGLTKALLTHV